MVPLPLGVKEVMYYAAAAHWVMLCENQYVALTGYVAQPRGGLKMALAVKSFVPTRFKLE